MLPDYLVGPENEGLRFLFDEKKIEDLSSISPVVLYGEKNVGKTALAITLAVRWSRLTGQRPLCFTTGQSFVDDYAAAVEIDDMASFRHRHRDCKLLVIDDLEPIVPKSAAQDELAHTLDCLSESRQPVIVSMSRLPSAISGLKPALSSRLSAGLSIQLMRPSPATRSEIVRSLAASLDKKLPVDELVNFCGHFSSSPLKAFDLKTIVSIAHQNLKTSGSVDFSVVSLLARQHFSGDGPSISDIAKAVAKRMRVKLLELRGSTREASIVRARGLAIYLSRKLTTSSLQQIGQFFGGRDHSTVLHACRKTERLLDTDSELANLLREVQAELVNGS